MDWFMLSPVLVACVTAPASYHIAKKYKIPPYKFGLGYSSTFIGGTIIIWLASNYKAKRTRDGTWYLGGFSATFWTGAHLVSYWPLLFATGMAPDAWNFIKKIMK